MESSTVPISPLFILYPPVSTSSRIILFLFTFSKKQQRIGKYVQPYSYFSRLLNQKPLQYINRILNGQPSVIIFRRVMWWRLSRLGVIFLSDGRLVPPSLSAVALIVMVDGHRTRDIRRTRRNRIYINTHTQNLSKRQTRCRHRTFRFQNHDNGVGWVRDRRRRRCRRRHVDQLSFKHAA